MRCEVVRGSSAIIGRGRNGAFGSDMEARVRAAARALLTAITALTVGLSSTAAAAWSTSPPRTPPTAEASPSSAPTIPSSAHQAAPSSGTPTTPGAAAIAPEGPLEPSPPQVEVPIPDPPVAPKTPVAQEGLGWMIGGGVLAGLGAAAIGRGAAWMHAESNAVFGVTEEERSAAYWGEATAYSVATAFLVFPGMLMVGGGLLLVQEGVHRRRLRNARLASKPSPVSVAEGEPMELSYEERRQRSRAARSGGRLLGVGIAVFATSAIIMVGSSIGAGLVRAPAALLGEPLPESFYVRLGVSGGLGAMGLGAMLLGQGIRNRKERAKVSGLSFGLGSLRLQF